MSRALEFLRAAQKGDGGWGYKPGGMTFVEPTAAAMLALESDAQSSLFVQRARAWLELLQHSDGGWGIAELDTESGWMTAWAVWALAAEGGGAPARGVSWLLAQAGLRVTDPAQIANVKRALQIDPTITGWAWQPNDAAWIFPTALTLLALDAMGVRDHPRVREGQRYLLDRAISTGGWNIGNPFMVTGSLPPTVENTSLALLALGRGQVRAKAVTRAQAWLAQDTFTPTAFEWAWRAYYWNMAGSDTGQAARARAALALLQREDGSWDGNPFTTAIAVMGGAV